MKFSHLFDSVCTVSIIMATVANALKQFELPKNILIAGCSQAGKSYFIKELLLHHSSMFKPGVNKIIYCFSVWQDKYDELEKLLGNMIEFRTDIPTKDELVQIWQDTKRETILVLDDKMSSMEDNATGKRIVEIVCVLCHHCHVSCIITLQNLYHASKVVREIGLNSQYICLFRNNRSVTQVRTLASQTIPTNIPYFMSSYDLATANSYGYLVVDLSANTDSRYKLKTNIFPQEETILFLPKK